MSEGVLQAKLFKLLCKKELNAILDKDNIK